MCGIAGSFLIDPSASPAGDRIHAALAALAHRGPDDAGVYRQGRAVLGHRRLSIIDTSAAGHQPFTDTAGRPATAGRRYTMVYNGEVFNYRELRARLEAEGHTFRSRSDTEVVLRLYTVMGEAFLHELNGFFALAIHDAETDTLLVARDRFGIKPLVWCRHDGAFHFASELRALRALGAPAEVDPGSLAQYLTYHYIAGPHTMLAGTHKLEPGHLLRVDAHGVAVEPWYDLVRAARPVPAHTDAKKELHHVLDDAVRDQLLADVPVGCFLSGGLDSSIISALAARHHRDLHTFSIGFADDPYYDESRHARAVAAHIGSTHHAFMLGTDDLAEAYPRFLAALDEPFADSSALAAFVLAGRTRRQVTVALSGDGADELFGGYRKHQAELRARRKGPAARAVISLGPLWKALPRSRNTPLTDLFRRLDRFA
ncbi:MAG: asparagine synthase (glutamine-hydrolyzing), partial [Flavobacteriales bacterium]|nr:asparagine synthase (glutamine-hydrolyzing) [Flavobacteriales bacterium]